MGKEKEIHPVQKWRKQQKQKILKQKKAVREQSRKAFHNRDPDPIILEIQKLEILEYENRITSDGKLQKKHLIDQFESLRKARRTAGMDDIFLPHIDFEQYEAEKKESRGQHVHESVDNDRNTTRNNLAYIESTLPPMPNESAPTNAPEGLPPYLNPLSPDSEAGYISDSGDSPQITIAAEPQLLETFTGSKNKLIPATLLRKRGMPKTVDTEAETEYQDFIRSINDA